MFLVILATLIALPDCQLNVPEALWGPDPPVFRPKRGKRKVIILFAMCAHACVLLPPVWSLTAMISCFFITLWHRSTYFYIAPFTQRQTEELHKYEGHSLTREMSLLGSGKPKPFGAKQHYSKVDTDVKNVPGFMRLHEWWVAKVGNVIHGRGGNISFLLVD